MQYYSLANPQIGLKLQSSQSLLEKMSINVSIINRSCSWNSIALWWKSFLLQLKITEARDFLSNWTPFEGFYCDHSFAPHTFYFFFIFLVFCPSHPNGKRNVINFPLLTLFPHFYGNFRQSERRNIRKYSMHIFHFQISKLPRVCILGSQYISRRNM